MAVVDVHLVINSYGNVAVNLAVSIRVHAVTAMEQTPMDENFRDVDVAEDPFPQVMRNGSVMHLLSTFIGDFKGGFVSSCNKRSYPLERL